MNYGLMPVYDEVQSGLEGIVAFATEIAEPDRDGDALRYRGVDIEELVGKVPFEQVWGLLVDDSLLPGPAAGRALSARRPLGRPARRHAGGARGARAAMGVQAGARHLRRAGARQPGARLGDGALLRRPVGPGVRPAAGAADGDRHGAIDRRALPAALARRGGPASRHARSTPTGPPRPSTA